MPIFQRLLPFVINITIKRYNSVSLLFFVLVPILHCFYPAILVYIILPFSLDLKTAEFQRFKHDNCPLHKNNCIFRVTFPMFGTAIALICGRQVWNHRWNAHLHEIHDIFNNYYKEDI